MGEHLMPLSDEHKKRRARNFAVAGTLVALVVIFFLVTLVNMG
jgi:hypothetical protein